MKLSNNMRIDKNIDPDFDVVRRCQKGDVDAFEELVMRYQKKMFNLSYRMVNDYNEAAEVVQDAFMSAYKNLKGFRGSSKFSSWLYTIVMNLSRNKLKQMKTRSCRENCSVDDAVETADGQITIEPESKDMSVLERLEKSELDQKVRECIQKLDSDFAEVIVLRDIQGFSYDEMSDILKVAAGTVKSRLFRARENIKKCLKSVVGDLQYGM